MPKKVKKILFLLLFPLFMPVFAMGAGNVTINYVGAPGSLFNIVNMAPGYATSRIITITNNTATNQTIKFRTNNISLTKKLSDKIMIRVVNDVTNVEKYNGTLTSLYSDGEVILDSIAPSLPTSYDFIATFDKNADNEYAGLKEEFDFTVGFEAVNTPTNFVGEFLSTLGFEEAPADVVVTDTPSVAGTTTETVQPTNTGEPSEVKGSSDVICAWWWIVGLILLVLLAFIGGVIRALYPEHFVRKYYYLWPLILGAVAWFAHYYLHNDLQATWFCDNYWFVMLVIVALAEVGYAYLARDKKNQ